VVVFTAHALQGRAAVETLLFAIALAVGLSPELLPAILSVNLTRGARMLAHRGWFVESLLTELAIALVVRTQRPFFRSRPRRLLLVSTLVLVMVTFAIPFLPFASLVGFVPLSPLLLATIAVV